MSTEGELLAGLDEAFRSKVKAVMAKLKADHGFRMTITEGSRSPWVQAVYWRQSRSRSEVDAKIAELKMKNAPFIAAVIEAVGPRNGRKVTGAIPGLSYHQYGQAIDAYVISPDSGRVLWRDEKDDGDEYDLAVRLYDFYGAVAKAAGLTWGGPWAIGDYGHIQAQSEDSPLKEYGALQAIDAAMKDRWGPLATTPHP